jgi:hypothetical protein
MTSPTPVMMSGMMSPPPMMMPTIPLYTPAGMLFVQYISIMIFYKITGASNTMKEMKNIYNIVTWNI